MAYKKLPYNPKFKEIAKDLRKNMTLSEVLLWKKLRNKQMMGYDFDRQKPIDKYIVDFYCKQLSLVIEIDGSSHNNEDVYNKDVERQKQLEGLGVKFLRFNDLEVKKSLPQVLNIIQYWIEDSTK
ncbi:MAG TPA: endonuclease domain-containing protein [Bacteroidia bacterium]|jgi:very-short-patch-repair endonuclease|nr:endonuclease domain-containing protein [Bacteroidia bacterium]